MTDPSPKPGCADDVAASPLTAGPPWVAAIHRRSRIDRQWLAVAMMMLASAATFFGWRALLHVLVAVMATTAVHLIALIIGGARCRSHHEGPGLMAVWLGMFTGLSLPLTQDHTLPLLAGAATGVLMHLVGRSHRLRVHPLAVVMVLLWLAPALVFLGEDSRVRRSVSEPIEAVLRPSHLIRGDVFELVGGVSLEPWWRIGDPRLPDGVRRASFEGSLWRHRAQLLTERAWLISMLSSGELPRFEEMLIGAVPGPVGATSPLLILWLGVYLIYRKQSDWRLGLAALVGATLTFLMMPVPGTVPAGSGSPTSAVWAGVAGHLMTLGPAAALTFFAYVLLASPLPLIVMIHAPSTMPITHRGRVVYGLILGSLAMAAIWLLAMPEACYLALLVVGLLSRLLDLLHHRPGP